LSPRSSRFAARSVSVACAMAPALARPMPFTKYFVAVDPILWFLFRMGRLKSFDEDKVIDSAVDCFWSRGYEATSVRDLAERMGIGGASLYNTYGDKRTLFTKALERYANRSMRERIARLEASHRPKQAIRAFLTEIIERSLEDPDRKGCLLVNSALDVAPHDAAIGKVVAAYLDEIRAFFRRNAEAARAAGHAPRKIDPDVVADHLLGVVLGIRVLARTGAKRGLLEGVARPALELLDLPVRSRGTRRTLRRRI
jgi:TetR/AcrR family transcriptional regulator, transcriptional repressor for nem operon